MILEPKHKNFTGSLQIKETVKKNIKHQAPYVYTKGFWLLLLLCYYFKIILNWWHSPFKNISGLEKNLANQ